MTRERTGAPHNVVELRQTWEMLFVDDINLIYILQERVGLLRLGGDALAGAGRVPDDALQFRRHLQGQATASSHQFAGKELI